MIQVGFFILLCGVDFVTTKRCNPCPNVKPMENFDKKQYTKGWFLVEEYPLDSNLATKCLKEEFLPLASGTVKVQVKLFSVKNGKTVRLTGYAAFVGVKPSSKLLGAYDHQEFDEEWILGTDYHSYSVHFTCGDIAFGGQNNVWILARSKNPPDIVLQKAYQLLKDNHLSTKLVKEDWTNCPYT